MFKIFRALLYGLMILDVAILPFGCGSKARENRNNYEVYFNFIYTNEEETIFSHVSRSAALRVLKGEELLEEDVINFIDDYFLIDRAYIVDQETNSNQLIKVTSYTLDKVTLYSHDYENNHIGKEIKLPYEFNFEEDRINYFEGIRGAYIVNLHINVEYEILPQDNYEK